MANTITLKVQDKTYTLEFNRRVIMKMEEDGIVSQDNTELEKKPFSYMGKLARYSFLKNHPDLSQKEIDDIFDEIGDLVGFFTAVAEMLKECVEGLNKGENKGNATWGKN